MVSVVITEPIKHDYTKPLSVIIRTLGYIVSVTRTRLDLIENCPLHRKTLQLFAVTIFLHADMRMRFNTENMHAFTVTVLDFFRKEGNCTVLKKNMA